MADSVETAIYRLRVEGEEQIKRVTQSIQGMDVAQEDATNSNRRLTQQIQRGLAAYDPVIKAQQQYNKQLELNARARESGAASLGELTAHQEAITQNYQRQVQAVTAVGTATKASRAEMINLGRQAQDVVVSLTSGQSIMMVGLQQGAQILDVFASSQRSVGQVFKDIGTSIVSFVSNPLTLAIGATTALGAVTLVLANNWDKVAVSSRRAISGAGARTGTTVEDLNKFVARTGGGGGTGLSDTEARQLGEAFTATGDIVISKLNGMSDAVRGFANQSGKSIDEAIKAWVRFGQDPVKAMDELAKVFGPLDQETRDLVQRFAIAGDKTQALAALVRGLGKDSKEAAENMGFWVKAWRAITGEAGREMQKPTGLSDQLKAAQANLGAVLAAPSGTGAAGQYGPDPAEIRKAADEVARLNAEMEKRSAEVYAAQMKQVADEARQVTEAVIPEIEQLRRMEEQLNKLKAAQAAGQGGPDNTAAIASLNIQVQKTNEQKDANVRINEELVKMQEKYKGVGIETAKVLASLDDELNLLKARGDYEKKSAQYAKDYNEAKRAGASNEEASQIASKKAAINLEQARDATRAANDATIEWQRNMLGVGDAAMAAADASVRAAEAFEAAQKAAQGADFGRGGDFGSFAVPAGTQYTSGGGGPIIPEGASELEKAYLGTFYGGGWDLPDIYAKRPKDQADLDAINDAIKSSGASAAIEGLNDSIGKLTDSTDSLNGTMKEALSPYYTIDPRTSHIGFRSQGMARGGYVDVPGGISSNDNMIATVPVASGERIYVDPMTSVRGKGASGQSISISMPITIQGSANKDDVGRTMYQAGQGLARQLQAAGR